MKDTAILTLNDFERIKKNARLQSKEEEENSVRIYNNQRECQYAKAKAFKQKLLDIDKNRGNRFEELNDIEKENIDKNNNLLSQAKKIMEQNEDCVKDMNHIVLYAKIASIRDRQLEEHKMMEKMYKRKESKLDLMMELERLKELKFQEDREMKRKKQQREGSLVIIDQIKDRELERLKEKEQIRKEGELMLKQIKELEEEDKRILIKKKMLEEKMAKEVEETNKIAALSKDKKKFEERELDLKILKYNLEKAKKEEEELAEKRRIQEEKEKCDRLKEESEKAKTAEINGETISL